MLLCAATSRLLPFIITYTFSHERTTSRTKLLASHHWVYVSRTESSTKSPASHILSFLPINLHTYLTVSLCTIPAELSGHRCSSIGNFKNTSHFHKALFNIVYIMWYMWDDSITYITCYLYQIVCETIYQYRLTYYLQFSSFEHLYHSIAHILLQSPKTELYRNALCSQTCCHAPVIPLEPTAHYKSYLYL